MSIAEARKEFEKCIHVQIKRPLVLDIFQHTKKLLKQF